MMRNDARAGSRLFQRAGLVLAGVAILGLTFMLGMLVGRQWARPVPQVATAESSKKSAAPARRIGLSEVETERPKAAQDKLTFYQTLTAPLGSTTSQYRAKPEEKGKPEARPKPDARPAAAPQPRTEEKPTAAAAASEAGPGGAGASQGAAPDQALAAGAPAWTVQVGAFKSRKQADAAQRGLSDAGFAAQVSALAADDGQPRYRVRVGSFRTRSDAERMAERLRASLALATYVTTN